MLTQVIVGIHWGLQSARFGDPRKTATHTYTTVYPHCNLNEKLTPLEPCGQLSLPISVAVLAVAEPVNPVIVTVKPKHKSKPKQGIQLTLKAKASTVLVKALH